MGCAAEGRHEPRDLDEFDAAGLTVASATYERLELLRAIRYRASVRSGDHVGSEAKDGVGTGSSTRPVRSTM
jgi:hypothetical protein